MPRAVVDLADANAPLLVETAAALAFPDGSMTVRTLRAERDRGRLDTWIVGKREYTSLAAVERMNEKCRAAQKARVSTSAKEKGGNPSMSSSTEETKPVPGSGLRSLERLKERLKTTSPARGSRRSGNVIPLKSRSTK